MCSSVIEIRDSSTKRVNAEFLLEGRSSWGAEQTIGRLARQFCVQNQGILSDFGIDAHVGYDGREIALNLRSSTSVGALPLLSPTTGKPDYGIVIRPRFGWAGIGQMLSQTGWRVIPTLLRLPELPRSDRKVPPWVLSSVVLRRIEALLESLSRKFAVKSGDQSAPRGRVKWNEYARSRLPRAKFLDVPCQYPELSEHREMLRAIHFVVRKHRASLSTQRQAGPMVGELLRLAQRLLREVEHVAPKPPSASQLRRWSSQPLQRKAFESGLQAIEWTVDDRGLAGLGDREGLAWILPMEDFFESWLEVLANRYARRHGGTVKVGRKQETVVPIQWSPPYIGSQKSLVPDVVIEKEEHTLIFDAKYKSHWEELDRQGWHSVRERVKNDHREDLLQLLAYANVSKKEKTTVCLVYPCRRSTWNSLRERQRVAHQAQIPVGAERLDVVLTTVPFDDEADGQYLKRALQSRAGDEGSEL